MKVEDLPDFGDIELGRIALARGGHVREPSTAIQVAAINYVIRERLSATLLQGLEDGRGALWFDYRTRTLYYLLEPTASGDERLPMAVATVSKHGHVEWL